MFEMGIFYFGAHVDGTGFVKIFLKKFRKSASFDKKILKDSNQIS